MLKQSVTSPHNIGTKKIWFIITLILMSMAGLVGSDLYLPALPAISTSLHQSNDAIQATLGIYLFGLSVGQLFFGPLTDRYGRKRLLILGMSIYLLASLSCALSFNYYQLLISRLFQAIGACSGLVIGRAIVADLYDTREAGRIFSIIFPFVGMSPAISPAIGGFISYYFGWRSNFILVALFALATIVLSHCNITESLLESKKKKLQLKEILKSYFNIATSKKFLFYATAPCVAYIAYFAYISQSPFIFHSHGFGDREIGMFYITLSLTYVIGNIFSRKLIKSMGINSVLKIGYFVFNTGAVLLLLSGFFHMSLLIMVISMSVLTFGNGFLIPLGTAGVVTSFSSCSGYVSGLLGFLQLGTAGLSSAVIGAISQNSIARIGIYIFAVTAFGFFSNYLLRPKE